MVISRTSIRLVQKLIDIFAILSNVDYLGVDTQITWLIIRNPFTCAFFPRLLFQFWGACLLYMIFFLLTLRVFPLIFQGITIHLVSYTTTKGETVALAKIRFLRRHTKQNGEKGPSGCSALLKYSSKK